MERHGAITAHAPQFAGRSLSSQRSLLRLGFAILATLSICYPARGDAGVILNESLHGGVSTITGSGHSAVYLSRVCAVSPVRLRLCDPGEQGSVISTYSNFGESQSFEWNIVPLTVFLYGVEDLTNRPLFASPQIKSALEEQYRRQFLSDYCAGPPCSTNDKANWRDMVGATFNRSVYIFVVSTTVEQDQDFIARFNALPNVGHFSILFRNCADFTREAINTYFPHAVHRDYFLNDFGMTSPKAAARSFVHYADHHPDMQLRVMHFAQLPGTIGRSNEVRDGTEQIFHSKKWLIPMAILATHELPLFPISYFLSGRFNPQHELEQHPTTRATEIAYQIQAAKAEEDDGRAEQLKAAKDTERALVVGSSEEWKRYRAEFASIVNQAVREEIIPRRDVLNDFFKQLDKTGTTEIDQSGALWMQIQDHGEMHKVGLNADTILAPGSDSHLALVFLLARINQTLKSPPHGRETMPEFTENWSLLHQAEERVHILAQSQVP
jgi:hypothetical protein